jgi:molecular chaperone GrpE
MVKGKKHEDVSVDRPDDTATDPLTQSASGSPEGRARDYEGQERRGDERRLQDRRTAERRASGEAAENPEKSALNENLRLKEAEVSKLQAELASLRDLSLRRQAEFDNYRKRMIKQQEDNKRFAIRDMALDIISVNDDLLRAISACSSMSASGDSGSEALDSLIKGVTMISESLEGVLKKYGAVEIDALDREFDPNFHEAIEIESSDKVDRDMVTKVHQKGFRIDDLVIRSTKVKVSKPARKEEIGCDSCAPGDANPDGGPADSR